MRWHALEKLDIAAEVRNADAIGIPLDEVSVAIGKALVNDLGLQHFKSAETHLSR